MTEPLKQMRRFTQALVVSGGLNILLLALLLYGVLGDGFLRWRNDMLIHRWPRTDEVVMDLHSRDEAINRLLAAQVTLRNNRRLQAAMRSSRLPAVKTLETFDFSFQPSLDRNRIMALAARPGVPDALVDEAGELYETSDGEVAGDDWRPLLERLEAVA